MDQRANMIMVSAEDVPTLRAFYEGGLGWSPLGPPSALSIMYKLGTSILVFLDAHYQAKESGIPTPSGPKSIWAIFVPNKSDVDTMLAQALSAGGAISSPARDRDLGLYSGYFTDPEGNAWEVAWGSQMKLAPDGALLMGG